MFTDSEDEEGAAAESAIVGDGRDDAKPRQWKSITGRGDFAKLKLDHRAISVCDAKSCRFQTGSNNKFAACIVVLGLARDKLIEEEKKSGALAVAKVRSSLLEAPLH